MEKQAIQAIEGLLKIMAYYHKDYSHEGHLDVCESPEFCGHCKASKAARETLSALKKSST